MSDARIAYMEKFLTDERKELLYDRLQYRTRHLTVAIENIFQPHNASAVLRSCDCFGVQDVHIIENSNEYVINPQVALGASKWLDLHRYNEQEFNTAACYDALREKGYRIVATSPHRNDCTLDELPIDQPLALIFGTEKDGLTDYALEHADEYVRIPMYGFTESFNISVCAAMMLHHVSEKMRKSGLQWQLSEAEQKEVLLNWVRASIPTSELVEQHFEKENR